MKEIWGYPFDRTIRPGCLSRSPQCTCLGGSERSLAFPLEAVLPQELMSAAARS
jgi:hypothetical protein